MRHIVQLDALPTHVPTETIPDGAVTGNGDLGITLGGTPDSLAFYLAKADFWQALQSGDSSGGIRGIGVLQIASDQFSDASWQVEMDLDEAVVSGSFATAEQKLQFRCAVCAVENIVLLECSGSACYQVNLEIATGNGSTNFQAMRRGILIGERSFEGPQYVFRSTVHLALKRLPDVSRDGTLVTRYALFVSSCYDAPNFREAVESRAYEFDNEAFDTAWAAHSAWWRAFYAKSSVEIADPQLELNWYAGQYFLACCGRNPDFPPGIFGNFITSDGAWWSGDYHLNYNYQAAFYAAVSSNHTELTDGYVAPLKAFVPEGRRLARELLGCRGLYYPVGIGPYGLNTSEKWFIEESGQCFNGQKSNAIHAADILIFRWNGTRDEVFAAEHVYPYLKEAVAFWEDYLIWENGRFSIKNDAAHEVPYYSQTFRKAGTEIWENDVNNIMTLGLLGMALDALLDLSETLGIDAEKRDLWRRMRDRLAPFPVFERNGKPVFRLTESGNPWSDTNAVQLQHIYPAGRIGLGSDPKWLEIARNTFHANDRWLDDNAFSSYAVCAARIGIDPEEILAGLRRHLAQCQYANLLFKHIGGCTENNGVVAATLNEMMLQGHEKIIRIFPVWPKNLDASFRNLRADGAFLVSAFWRNGSFGGARIHCEKGGTLRLDPSNLGMVRIFHNQRCCRSREEMETMAGDLIEILSGNDLVFDVSRDKSIYDINHSAILREMDLDTI